MNLDNQAINKASMAMVEQLSALMDGELTGAELQQLLDALPDVKGGEDCYVSVQSYLLIGEVLRAPAAGYRAQTSNLEFLSALNAKLAQEPALAPVAQPLEEDVAVPSLSAASPVQMPVQREAANESVFRWKLVAGFASLAAVAMVGWSSLGLVGGGAPVASGQQLASAAPTGVTPTTAQGLVQMPVTVGQNATVMLRDPRLDELLAARGQIGGTANLQMPASFLRNATFNAEKKSGGCPDKASRLC